MIMLGPDKNMSGSDLIVADTDRDLDLPLTGFLFDRCGRWTLMSVIPPEGLTRRIFGPGTGPDSTRRPLRFIWTNFQAKRTVLDPFGTKFDAFGASHNFGGDLTSPVLLCTIPAGAFFQRKWPPLDLTSPVAANQLAAGAFFR